MNLGPAFPFYPDRFMGSDSVTMMDLEAIGAYVLLMIFQWNNGSIPADPAKLSKICKNISPKKMAALWEQLSGCYQEGEPGRLINEFMDEIRKERIAYKESRAESGRAGGIRSGEARAKQEGRSPSILLPENRSKREANTQAKRSSPSPSPSPEGKGNINSPNPIHSRSTDRGSPPGFTEFWKEYPKKKSKGAALKAWRGHQLELKAAEIIKAVKAQRDWPEWVKDSGKYIPHPASWLNAQGWDDEFWQPKGDHYPGKIERREPKDPNHVHQCNYCEKPHAWRCEFPEICGIVGEPACPEYAARYAR